MLEDGRSSKPSSSDVAHTSPICSAFNRLLAARTHRLRIDHVGVVAVVELQRYLAQLHAAPCNDAVDYSYDVTITDGRCQAKCGLAPHLNSLVQKNMLRTGVDIRVEQCCFVYDEKKLGHAAICIEKVEIVAVPSVILRSIRDVDALPLWSMKDAPGDVTVPQRRDAPIHTSRKHYLSLWNNEDPHGYMWVPQIPPQDVVLDVSKTISVCDLENSFKSVYRHLPLLIRIIHKSRLRFYGKLDTKIDFPYQAYFEVADHSGSISMVLWNALCVQWYHRLNVGAVLYLQNYTVKQSYQNRSRPCLGDPRMRAFSSVEICLNPRDPVAVITVIPPRSVQPQWSLPNVTYHFTTSLELESLPPDSVCDIIGLVTFVGRCERVKNKGMPEKYWTYRWVHAVDGTSDVPFILEIFASSQPEIFYGICPMTYLVCTQMRVRREAGTLPYLTSSCETQIFTTGFHKGQPYVTSPKVKSFIQWTKTLKESVVLKKAVIGGNYCYPPSPPVFTQMIASELQSLQYRERRRLAIQGQITAVQYVAWPEESQGHSGLTTQVCISTALCMHSKAIALPQYMLTPVENIYPVTVTNKCISSDFTCLLPKFSAEGRLASNRLSASWESRTWEVLKGSLTEHFQWDALQQDSIPRKFTFEEKDYLLRQNNFHPARWTPDELPSDQSGIEFVPVSFNGYFRVTVLGINQKTAIDAVFVPVVSCDDPRSVGLPQDAHNNTLLSCLSSGFISPLSERPPHIDPGNAYAIHVVCLVDLCHLGGEKVEVFINKVYKMTDVTFI
uniref:RPA1 related single stranded DNA binding protein, X-linked n=1 Tax=Scleropages formosus TaxID=113540 RepID=A0A8C9RH96_SCLFO